MAQWQRITVFLSLLISSHGVYAQYKQSARNAFLHRDIVQAFDYWSISKPSIGFHSGFKPYLSSTYRHATDSAVPFTAFAFSHHFLSRTFNERPERRNWYNLQIHPIADVEAGYDGYKSRVISATSAGAHVKLNINDDFTFAATGVGGNVQLPFFADTILSKQRVLPEFGQTYKSPSNSGYNFFDWQGYVSFSPQNGRWFNLQAGRDRHFIGDGYRSLLLSDLSPAYPYFRAQANVWRLQYDVWYSWMFDVTNSNGVRKDFHNKFGTFHYLSYNITKSFNIGFFENIVWRGTDTNQVRTFDVNYLNPVILYRPVEYSLGSSDNAFMGLTFKADVARRVRLYGQLALDEFFLKEIRARRGWWANKQGWQLGIKSINTAGIRGLTLQGEFNQVRPYTYTHGIVDQNYAHYGFPLAHPLGANFREVIAMTELRRNRVQFGWQGMFAVLGRDSAGNSNVGQNIFLSYVTRPFEYGHRTGQGINTTVIQNQLKLTWHLLPAMSTRIELAVVYRAETNENGHNLKNPWFFVAFRTGFWNVYRDF